MTGILIVASIVCLLFIVLVFKEFFGPKPSMRYAIRDDTSIRFDRAQVRRSLRIKQLVLLGLIFITLVFALIYYAG